MAQKFDVGTPGISYTEMLKDGEWDLLEALKGGTRAMRAASWMPKNPREREDAYRFRRERSFLYPGFNDALDSLTSLPFQKPLTLEVTGTIDEKLARLEADADREGTRLHDWAHMVDELALTYGLAHILVDYPSVPDGSTRQDDQELDVRPYFCAISPRNLIRWRTAKDATDKSYIASITISETRVELVEGEFVEAEVEYIKTITPTTWERWRKPPGASDWAPDGSGENSLGRIPLVTVYYNQTGLLTGLPPLLDLAFCNWRHFLSESDQDTALSFARIPLLFGRGMRAEEVKTINEVGPGQGIFCQDPAAQLGTVEHSGAAIEAGRLHGKDILDQMVALGAQPLVETTSATATGEMRQDKRATSKRQEWANALANGIESAYGLAALWLQQEMPERFKVNINGDFVLAGQAATHLVALQSARNMRDISQDTLIAEFKKRGVLGANVDAEVEREMVGEEGPALSSFGA